MGTGGRRSKARVALILAILAGVAVSLFPQSLAPVAMRLAEGYSFFSP